MNKDYTITSIKKGDEWTGSYGTFQNYALALEGVGEPVKWSKTVPVTDEPVVGEVIFGRLTEERAGTRVYYKFNPGQKPGVASDNDRQSTISAQWAIGQAVTSIGGYYETKDYEEYFKRIEDAATHFYKMIKTIKESK
jgi:hypothetical protein